MSVRSGISEQSQPTAPDSSYYREKLIADLDTDVKAADRRELQALLADYRDVFSHSEYDFGQSEVERQHNRYRPQSPTPAAATTTSTSVLGDYQSADSGYVEARSNRAGAKRMDIQRGVREEKVRRDEVLPGLQTSRRRYEGRLPVA